MAKLKEEIPCLHFQGRVSKLEFIVIDGRCFYLSLSREKGFFDSEIWKNFFIAGGAFHEGNFEYFVKNTNSLVAELKNLEVFQDDFHPIYVLSQYFETIKDMIISICINPTSWENKYPALVKACETKYPAIFASYRHLSHSILSRSVGHGANALDQVTQWVLNLVREHHTTLTNLETQKYAKTQEEAKKEPQADQQAQIAELQKQVKKLEVENSQLRAKETGVSYSPPAPSFFGQ